MNPTDAQERTALGRGAVAIIVNRKGQVLLHLRDDVTGITWPGFWSVLGGACEHPGETPREAITRELDEEAGLHITDLTELFERPDTFGSGRMVTFFAGTWNGDPAGVALSEGVKLQFFDPTELAALRIPGYIRNAIEHRLGSPTSASAPNPVVPVDVAADQQLAQARRHPPQATWADHSKSG